MDFCASLQFKFLCASKKDNKTIYVIEIEKKIYDFTIWVFNQIEPTHPRFSILVELPDDFIDKYEVQNNSPDFPKEDDEQPVENDEKTIGASEASNFYLYLREEVQSTPFYVDIDKLSKQNLDKILIKLV